MEMSTIKVLYLFIPLYDYSSYLNASQYRLHIFDIFKQEEKLLRSK